MHLDQKGMVVKVKALPNHESLIPRTKRHDSKRDRRVFLVQVKPRTSIKLIAVAVQVCSTARFDRPTDRGLCQHRLSESKFQESGSVTVSDEEKKKKKGF